MMLACRINDSTDNVQVAAADTRTIVTGSYGTGTTDHFVANGVGWYGTNDGRSWGFFPAGEALSRNSCDTQDGMGEKRLCWHTLAINELSFGYRCGTNKSLNSNSVYQRMILVGD